MKRNVNRSEFIRKCLCEMDNPEARPLEILAVVRSRASQEGIDPTLFFSDNVAQTRKDLRRRTGGTLTKESVNLACQDIDPAKARNKGSNQHINGTTTRPNGPEPTASPVTLIHMAKNFLRSCGSAQNAKEILEAICE